MKDILYGFDPNNHEHHEIFDALLSSKLFQNCPLTASIMVYLASYNKESNDLFIIKIFAGSWIEAHLKSKHPEFQTEEAQNLLKALLKQVGSSGIDFLNRHPDREFSSSRVVFERWKNG